MVAIKKEVIESIIEHGKNEYPYECCGMLAGTNTNDKLIIEKSYYVKNMDKSSEHFTMDPQEQFDVMKKIRGEGLTLLGNYHSHPYTPSRPSEEDKRLAYDESAIYGILSLEKEEPMLKFFKIIAQQKVEKIEIEIV